MKVFFALLLVSSPTMAGYDFKHCNPRSDGAGSAKEYEIQKDGSLSIPKELGAVISRSMSPTLDKIVVQAKDRAPGTHIYELQKVDGKPKKLIHISPLFGDKNPQKSTLIRTFSYDKRDNCFLEDIELGYNDGKDANKRLVTYQTGACEKFVKSFKDAKATKCSQEYMNKCVDLVPGACIEKPNFSCAEMAKSSCISKLGTVCGEEATRLNSEISNWDKSLRLQNRELFGYKKEELFVIEDPFALAMNIASSCRYTRDFYSPEKKLWEVWKVFKKDHASGVDEGEDPVPAEGRTRDSR